MITALLVVLAFCYGRRCESMAWDAREAARDQTRRSRS